MLKRVVDIGASAVGLIFTSPILFFFAIAVWLQDFRSPFYVADRIGLGGKAFRMVKLRSMVVNAERSGVTSTSDVDARITAIGQLIRKLKIDEITQLWNVLLGDMSLVGPRPNVAKWGVELYTEEEMRLLSVRPGITDFASIVFADESSILSTSDNPDLAYNQLIRPWKSRLGLFYIRHQRFWVDLELIWLTVVNAISREVALSKVVARLERLGAPPQLLIIAKRSETLIPYPPPGKEEIVQEM